MFCYFSMSYLFLLLLPLSDLSHPDYQIRERATKQFIQAGLPAVKILEGAAARSNDAEFIMRAEFVRNKYFEDIYTDQPIWYLPTEFRKVNGKDMADLYYDLAAGIFNPKIHDDISTLATQLYFYDMIKDVDKRELVREIKIKMELYASIIKD